jgi:epoxyqueuosine reductase QueG
VLNDLLQWTDAEYAEVLRASAIKRAKPAMLRRNAQVAQANAKRARSEPRP